MRKAIVVALALVGSVCATSFGARAEIKTIEQGVLTVAVDNEMPFCKEENGAILGTEGEILTEIAKRLGLTVKPAVMDWTAEIQAVQSGRVDVAICGMAWTAEREKIIGLSDTVYNQKTDLTQRVGAGIKSIKDMKGKKFGTIQGAYYIPNFQKLLGPENVLLYGAFDAAYQDLAAGRVDVVTVTSATSGWMAKQHPEWNIEVVPMPEEDFKQLEMKPNRTVFGVNPQNVELLQAVNGKLKELKEDGTYDSILQKYGIGNLGMQAK